MLRIFVAARALAGPLLNLRGAVLAALIAAILAILIGPFVASVLLGPMEAETPSAPVKVAGMVTTTPDGTTTAILTGVFAEGEITADGTPPFENILDPGSSSPLSDLLEPVSDTVPFDNLALVSTSFDGASTSPDFVPADPSDLPGFPGFGNSLFFSSGGGVSQGPPISDPGDVSSSGSQELQFSVTFEQLGGEPSESDATGENPGLTITGKIFVLFVPEPSTLLLMGAGLSGLVLLISRLIH